MASPYENIWSMFCLKYLVIAFNTIFLMTGLMIISTGTTVIGFYYYLNRFLETSFFSPATLLIITGCFIVLITIMGYLAIMKESTVMMSSYCVLLCFVFLLQFSAGIAAVALKGQVQDTIASNMNISLHQSPFDAEAFETIEEIQTRLRCCGINNPTDWTGIFILMGDLKYDYKGMILPDSCCAEFVHNNTICKGTHPRGCLPGLSYIIYQTLRILFGTCLTLSIIELTGIYFAYNFVRTLIRHKSEKMASDIILRQQRMYECSAFDGTNYAFEDKPPSYEEVQRHYK